MTSIDEIPNPVGLELTHDQGYALANLLTHIDDEFLLRHAKTPSECGHMVWALAHLQAGLEEAGYYPSEATENPDA